MCVCVCHHLFLRLLILHNPQVLRRRHFLTASITSPLYSSRGQRPVFLRCPTKLRKTGGSIQGRLNVYLPFSFQLLNKLSNPVFCSKRLMQSNKLFNTFNYTDFFTFRFVYLSVSSSQGGFIPILALASNHLSVCVCVRVRARAWQAEVLRKT